MTNHPPVASPADEAEPTGGERPPSTGVEQSVETPHRRFRRTRAAIGAVRANPTGRFTLKVTIALIGAVIVAVGLVLVPLPGPGWALVMLGLAVWAIEFAWARHLLGFTRRKVLGWTHWVRRQPWPIRLVIGLATAAFVAAVAVLSLRYGLGVDVLTEVKEYVAAH